MYPKDIDPESGSRLPLPKREELDPVAQGVYDKQIDPKGGSLVGLHGPAGIRLHSPRAAEYSQPLNRYLRTGAGFDPKIREVAILISAREADSQFEWSAHEPEALSVGVDRAVVEIIKHRRSTDGLDPDYVTVIELGRALFRDHKVSSALYARALKQFGARGLVDLVSLMGNYAATAALLTAFDMQVDPSRQKLLPEK